MEWEKGRMGEGEKGRPERENSSVDIREKGKNLHRETRRMHRGHREIIKGFYLTL